MFSIFALKIFRRLTVSQCSAYMYSIFVHLIFVAPAHQQKYFNGENFPIYGTLSPLLPVLYTAPSCQTNQVEESLKAKEDDNKSIWRIKMPPLCERKVNKMFFVVVA